MINHIVVRMFSLVIVMIALLICVPPAAATPADQGTSATYRLTIKNLAHTQALSPPLIIIHGTSYHLFRVGTYASVGMRLIAEMGDVRNAINHANVSKGVRLVRVIDSVIAPGKSATLEFRAPVKSLVSVATMLEQTNDGFTGVDGAILPRKGVRTIHLGAYDAGTEANNELKTHVPGPPYAGFRRAPTRKLISVHGGIQGVGDLKASVWNWSGKVAVLTIERVP